MCGITGVYLLNNRSNCFNNLPNALQEMVRRGPDAEGTYINKRVALGHRRLSVIDLSEAASQPMTDSSGRYTIVLNGEIFNHQTIRKDLEHKGITFRSNSDTEVLLQLYILEGIGSIEKLNGFFAFSLYDAETEEMFLVRDRFGIKPLLWYSDTEKIIFASEMKALLAYGFHKEMDEVSVSQFFNFNYIPHPYSCFKGVKKLAPGCYLKITPKEIVEHRYYEVPYHVNSERRYSGTYDSAKQELKKLLEDSVKLRLESDVPLGIFVSGGIDSSAVAALASRHISQANAFSIGYSNAPFYDETHYASLVAKKFNLNHAVFSLSDEDLSEHISDVLDYLDEPFGDASAIPTYILSKETKKYATVALSGDGGDELFAGYHRHIAEYKARNSDFRVKTAIALKSLWKKLPESRETFLSNKIRQLRRFSETAAQTPKERYLRWAMVATEENPNNLFSEQFKKTLSSEERERRDESFTKYIHGSEGLDDVLFSDVRHLLPDNMLHKVDMMSMANCLEVRVPFLDYRVANFAFSLPSEFKTNGQLTKKIVQDAFRDILPAELYNRPKKGFGVPLMKIYKTYLRSYLEKVVLADDFIREQGIFNPTYIAELKRKLFSERLGDLQARIWSIIVFQHWWKKYMMS